MATVLGTYKYLDLVGLTTYDDKIKGWINNALGGYVKKTGDTMTGTLSVPKITTTSTAGEGASYSYMSPEEIVAPSFVSAYGAQADGLGSHALGHNSNAADNYSIALGYNSKALGYSSIASGESSKAEGYSSIASGAYSVASGDFSTTLGYCSKALGYSSKASGDYSTASGYYSVASGNSSIASGAYSVASGYYSEANGDYSTASGDSSEASGDYSTASGAYSVASGMYSTASGDHSEASGTKSIASGSNSIASGSNSIASGCDSEASGDYSTASGAYSVASHFGSFIPAHYGKSGCDFQTVIGKYNKISSTDLFVIGNGASDTDRKNAMTVSNNGDIWAKGSIMAETGYILQSGADWTNSYRSIGFSDASDKSRIRYYEPEFAFNPATNTLKLGTGTLSATEYSGNSATANSVILNTLSDSLNGHEYVDLCLPSGLKWATCNVGATTPEACGDYFAWGEVEPKDNYSSGNCETCGQEIGDISGNIQYDAATANWGGSWCMPTGTEYQELIDECSWEWTTQNNVNGYIVTGSNGNSIFLPTTGYYSDTSLRNAGEYGYYWASSPSDEETYNYAHGLYFSSSTYHANDNANPSRFQGFAVRPVIKASYITSKLFHSTNSELTEALESGKVSSNDVVFIEDTKEIYHNGTYYGGSTYEPADASLKDFGEDIPVDFDKLKDIPKKYFTWKGDTQMHIGTSAQAVQEVYPELVKSTNDQLAVDYSKLAVIALKAIDVLNDKIASLEQEIEYLKNNNL